MSETNKKAKKRQMATVLFAFAPFITAIGFTEAGEAIKDPEWRPWVYLIVGADLLYIGTIGLLLVYGGTILSALAPFIQVVLDNVSQLDPHLVWYPWQVVAGSIIVGAVLLAIGYYQAEWTPKEDLGETDG